LDATASDEPAGAAVAPVDADIAAFPRAHLSFNAPYDDAYSLEQKWYSVAAVYDRRNGIT
jgi:hypothetical protein